MTYGFLCDTGFNLNECVIDANGYQRLDILESSMDAIREGVDNNFVLKTQTSYAYSMIDELLNNVKKILLELLRQALSLLNNLYSNNIRLMEKYKDILIDRLKTLDDPVFHDTYVYPKCDDYPIVIKTGMLEKEIKGLQNMAVDPTVQSDRVGRRVDEMLLSFGKSVTKETIDPYNLVDSTAKAVRKKTQGKKKRILIGPSELEQYVQEIKTYKSDREELVKARKAILEEYEALKSLHTKATENPVAVMKNTVRYQVSPDKEEFLAQEYNRYADIHTELLRLFNGYITIYRVAFDTKINCILERYNDHKAFITKLFTVTGIFSALNTKNAKDPIVVDTRKKNENGGGQ